MMDQEIISLAEKAIREEFSSRGIPVLKIVLFGSQARHTARPDSDWDFLVIIKNPVSFPEKVTVTTKIQRKLAEKHIAVDVVIKTEAQSINERKNVGFITYYALKEGLSL
jgi:uncharacterized protein